MSLQKYLLIHRSVGSRLLVCCATIVVLQGGGFAAAANHESADTQDGESWAEGDTPFERMMARHRQAPSAAEVLDSIQSGSLGKIASLTVLGKIPSPASEPREIPVHRELGIHEVQSPDRGVSEEELMDAICLRRVPGYRKAAVEPVVPRTKQVAIEIDGTTASLTQSMLGGNTISSLAENTNPPIAFGLFVGISTLLSRRRIRRFFAVRSIR